MITNVAGHNMSPANVEARLKAASPLIGQAVCINDARPYTWRCSCWIPMPPHSSSATGCRTRH